MLYLCLRCRHISAQDVSVFSSYFRLLAPVCVLRLAMEFIVVGEKRGKKSKRKIMRSGHDRNQ